MLPALSQSLRLEAGLNIPKVHVGKVSFHMLKTVYYTILVLGVASAFSIVLGLLLIVLPGPMLLFGIVPEVGSGMFSNRIGAVDKLDTVNDRECRIEDF